MDRQRCVWGMSAALLLWGGEAAGYVRYRTAAGVPLRWPSRCVSWQLHAAGSDDLDPAVTAAEVAGAFATWEAVECSALVLPAEPPTHDGEAGYRADGPNHNRVVWRERAEDWHNGPGVVALTLVTFCQQAGEPPCDFAGEIVDADIEVNGAEFTFTATRVPEDVRADVRNVLTHEAGHLIGFDHSAVRAATMYGRAVPGDLSLTTLHEDDIAAVCDVYPLDAGGEACAAFDAGASDGGVTRDAGVVDAGDVDEGRAEAGPTAPDAEADAVARDPDAGLPDASDPGANDATPVAADAGVDARVEREERGEDGCDCRTTTLPPPLPLLAAGALVYRRRRVIRAGCRAARSRPCPNTRAGR